MFRTRPWRRLSCGCFLWAWIVMSSTQSFLQGFQHRSLVARGQTMRLAQGELMEETKLLRETLGSLTEEVRLLRELLDSPTAATAETSAASASLPSGPTRTTSERTEGPKTTRDPPAKEGIKSVAKGKTDSSEKQPKQPEKTRPAVGSTNLKVVSAGGDAGDIADFFVEDQKVPIGGMSNRRGLNVVVIDTSMGQVLSAKTYDIWGNPMEENRRLAKDFRAIEEDNVVLVALKDSGMENLDGEALHALQSIGSTLESRLSFRQGYALIGLKDREALAERKGPMVMAEAKLKSAVRPPQAPVRA